jgi:hypothetical protein
MRVLKESITILVPYITIPGLGRGENAFNATK